MSNDHEQTASLMTPAKLAQAVPRVVTSPADWLDKMAADAGHSHVAHLLQLQSVLQAQGSEGDVMPMSVCLGELSSALAVFDFDLIQTRGWWARATGKARSAGAEFTEHFQGIESILKDLAVLTAGLSDRHNREAAVAERALVELEVEYQALGKVVEQGARWLSDMRTQLKERHAATTDAQVIQQLKQDAARCEILVVRLKALRATGESARQVHQLARAATVRRVSLVQLLQQSLKVEARTWQLRVSELASSGGGAHGPTLGLEGPKEAHALLRQRVDQLSATSRQLQDDSAALVVVLADLARQLKALMPT